MAIRLSTATRNAKANAAVDLIDAGAAAGTIKIYSGAQPASADTAASGTLLATFTLSDPAFGNAVDGTATASAIADVLAAADGTAGWFRTADSNGATVHDGSVTATGGGGDMELNTTTLVTGVSVSITSYTYTQPAG